MVSQVQAEVAQLGEDVLSDQVIAWITDAEKNTPYLAGHGRDIFGKTTSKLVVGEGWRSLQAFGIARGMVATGYDTSLGQSARVVQFLRLHLWEGSAANVPCPSAMQDGAARLLQLQLARRDLGPELRGVLGKALGRLLSRDPARAWTSGQWMTERTGGSDVSLTETVAEKMPSAGQGLADAQKNIPLGPWSISGFKWFSSATDSNMTILLARTDTHNGVSAFYAPMRRHHSSAITQAGRPIGAAGAELNGVRIQRLKTKLGTRSLPTAELELEGMRGWLLGREGHGVKEISTVLTLTRVHSAVAAVGYVGRALGVARAYAKVRQVGAGRGRRVLLAQSPLHMQTLADMMGRYHGLMLLTFFTSHVLGLDENPDAGRSGLSAPLAAITPDQKHVAPLLRVLTPLCKAYVCKNAIHVLYECMEALGGVGYLENEEAQHLNIARLYRDCCVLSIWEGTTDVLATDFLRALKHPKGGQESIDALDSLLGKTAVAQAGSVESIATGPPPTDWWEKLKGTLARDSQADLTADARHILWAVAEGLIDMLLYADAHSDGSQSALDMLSRWRLVSGGQARHGTVSSQAEAPQSNDKQRLAGNYAIVYGQPYSGASMPKL